MRRKPPIGCRPPKPHRPIKDFCDYQFVLLNEDQPVGCVKGYRDKNEVILYICGMKNTFHISPYISRCEMKDFLGLAMSDIFTKTYFGAKIKIPGLDGVRQLFGIVENKVNNEWVSSSWKDEMGDLDNPEENTDLDIYPDVYEEDNTKSEVDKDDLPVEIPDNPSDPDISSEETNEVPTIPTEDKKDENRPFCEEVYVPEVNIYLEDKEYGPFLDIYVTGFVDAQKPPHHHHHKPKQEFDIDPTDDMDSKIEEADGIDHINAALYL